MSGFPWPNYMKELSIEEKAKRYDKALERAKNLRKDAIDMGENIRAKQCEIIFPELKEGDDERIRKELLEHCKNQAKPYIQTGNKCPQIESWIAWLEKQAEVESDKGDIEDERIRKAISQCVEDMRGQFEKLYRVHHKDAIAWLEKQKPVEFCEEDEKIRKAISIYLDWLDGRKDYAPRGEYSIRDMLVWLNKQSEQNPKHFELKAGHWYICHRAFCCRADHLTVKEGERFMCEKDGIVKGFVIKEPEKYFKEVCAPAPMEDEQKPSDKVEPKFKIGDWITNGHCKCQITFIDSRYWYSKTCVLGNVIDIDKTFHLWTIQDARDGDVLVTDFEEDNMIVMYHSMCTIDTINVYCCLDNKFVCGNLGVFEAEDVKPATKEQRELLFQKMHEAGYEWDADKKELKKIEDMPLVIDEGKAEMDYCFTKMMTEYYTKQKPDIEMKTPEESLGVDSDTYNKIVDECVYGEQKPAWSEEDEMFVHGLIRGLAAKRDIHGHTTFSSDCIDITKTINWLKSLKDRCDWKIEDK